MKSNSSNILLPDPRNLILSISPLEREGMTVIQRNQLQLRFLEDTAFATVFIRRIAAPDAPTSFTLEQIQAKNIPGLTIIQRGDDTTITFSGDAPSDDICMGPHQYADFHQGMIDEDDLTYSVKPEQVTDLCFTVELNTPGLWGRIVKDHPQRDQFLMHSFKRNGAGGIWDVMSTYRVCNCYVVIKPFVGEDYPQILREMVNARRGVVTRYQETDTDPWIAVPCAGERDEWVLVVDKFESHSTSPVQLQAFFRMQEMQVIFLRELE